MMNNMGLGFVFTAHDLDGIRDIARGLVYDPMVIGLKTNTNALSSHTKNNCLLMVVYC